MAKQFLSNNILSFNIAVFLIIIVHHASATHFDRINSSEDDRNLYNNKHFRRDFGVNCYTEFKDIKTFISRIAKKELESFIFKEIPAVRKILRPRGVINKDFKDFLNNMRKELIKLPESFSDSKVFSDSDFSRKPIKEMLDLLMDHLKKYGVMATRNKL